MRVGKMQLSICAAVLTAVAAGGVYVKDAANPPTALDDGKITFAYDDSGAITEMRTAPTSGETLTLSGDVLEFASGARFVPGPNGTTVISNVISAAALQIGTLSNNLTWTSNSAMNSVTPVKLFENVRLTEISVVSAIGTSYLALSPNAILPYFVRRSEDGASMTVELQQLAADNTLRAVLLELTQVDADIYGRVAQGWLVRSDSNGNRYCGYSLFDVKPAGESYRVNAPDASRDGFGIRSLTICPRRETHDYEGAFLSDAYDTVVATNECLSDVEILYGTCGYRMGYAGIARGVLEPHHVRLENGVLSAQMFSLFESYTKCVKIELRQSGSNVVARAVYAKYKNDKNADYDFDVTGTSYNLRTPEKNPTHGYGVDMLALRHKSRTRLTLPVAYRRDIPVALSGSGVEIAFEAVPTADGSSGANIVRSGDLWCGGDYMTLTAEHALKDITIVSGRIAGAWANGDDGTGYPAVVCEWRYDPASDTATCQMQALRNGTEILIVDLELKQDGEAVKIRAVRAANNTNGVSYYGVSRMSGGTTRTVSTGTNKQAYGVPYVEYDTRPHAFVSVSAANTMADSVYVVRGLPNCPITFQVAQRYALPSGALDCLGDATLLFSAGGTYNNGVSKGCAMTMHDGTKIVVDAAYPFHYEADAPVVLDHAAAEASFRKVEAYANFLTFANGSSVVCTSRCFRVGYTPSPQWRVTGVDESFWTGDVSFVGKDRSTGISRLTIDVEDTVAGGAPDFTVNGDLVHDGSYPHGTFTKLGLGTMRVNGKICITNEPVRVSGGTLLLGKSGATEDGVDFVLEGGTLALAAGTANVAASIAATDDSSLSVGAGARLELSGLSVPEGAALAVEYAGDVDNRGVRVATALDKATLARITLNGERASQSSGGYLCRGGFIIIVR